MLYAILDVESGMHFGEVRSVSALVVVKGSPRDEVNCLYESRSFRIHKERHFYEAVKLFYPRGAFLPLRNNLLEKFLVR